MALPTLAPTFGFRPLRYDYEVVDCSALSVRGVGLSDRAFYVNPNPLLTYPARRREVTPAFGAPIPIHHALDSAMFEPYDLEMTTQIFKQTGQDANDLRGGAWDWASPLLMSLQGFNDEAVSYNERHFKHNQLVFQWWNTGSWYYLYLYADFVGMRTVSVPHTGGDVVDLTLQFRVVDPIFYDNPATTTINVLNCGPTTGSVGAFAFRRRTRMCIYVRNNSNHDPSLVVITNDRGDSANFGGQLTILDEYWKLDCMEGRLYRGTSYVTETDVTGTQFSGDFLSADILADTFSATCDSATSGNGAATDFQVEIVYRNPKL